MIYKIHLERNYVPRTGDYYWRPQIQESVDMRATIYITRLSSEPKF
jgi:hypothetical protein